MRRRSSTIVAVVVISRADFALLMVAGVCAGVVGSSGGITSLISYPALLAVGLSPLPANVTNVVALVASFPGSTLGSRPELRGRGSWLRRWAGLAAFGGVVGVVLLLLTPDRIFDRVVPFLLALASVALLAQPSISRWLANRPGDVNRTLFPLGVFAVTVYTGYFGAGSGVMTLALMLLLVEHDVPIANALKNFLLGVADVAAAAGFALFGPVHWIAVAALAPGLFVGSVMGPSLTRRIPGTALRALVALTGLGFAAWLWYSHG